jgi:hypothetical protein
MFFTGAEEMINALNESKNVSAVQRELERITKRTDLKIKDIVWQGYWR